MVQSDEELRESYLYDLHERMSNAAEAGNEGELQTLLAEWREGGDSDQEIIDGCLIGAVRANRPASVRQLMACGAKADETTADVATSSAVSTDVWQALLDHGWDINSCNTRGHLVIFAFFDDPSIDPKLTWFLSHGASLKACDRAGLNPLAFAAAYRPVSVLRVLIEHGGGGNVLIGSSALHQAAFNRDEDRTAAMTVLVDEFGADVHELGDFVKRKAKQTRESATPLHFAVHSGRREHVHFLLDRGAKVTEKDSNGRDVRAYASSVNCPEGWKAVEEWFAERGQVVPGEAAERERVEGGS